MTILKGACEVSGHIQMLPIGTRGQQTPRQYGSPQLSCPRPASVCTIYMRRPVFPVFNNPPPLCCVEPNLHLSIIHEEQGRVFDIHTGFFNAGRPKLTRVRMHSPIPRHFPW